MKNKTKILIAVSSVVLLVGFFVLGIYIGYAHRPSVDKVIGISNTQEPAGITADFEPFWNVWNLINEKYADAGSVSNQDRVYGAIKGLVASLGDPYSVFFTPQDSTNFEDTIQGSFGGIGMEMGIKNNELTVIAPLKDTPAEKAGLRAGDIILKIDDTTVTSDMSVDQAVNMIRGPKGTSVQLTIERGSNTKPIVISVTRDVINIPTIDATLRPDGIFVISLYTFTESSASLFAGAVQKFNQSGSKELIIDLRGNPGGYLSSAVDIASMFLPEGDVVVSENTGKPGDTPTVYRSKGYGLVDTKNTKIVILVDKGSASASEILAGALSEHGIAPLIGETTYGKGSVQEVMNVTPDTTVKLTVAKWYTPDGISISKKGLTPDITVTVSDSDLAAGKDPILDRAVQYLENGK